MGWCGALGVGPRWQAVGCGSGESHGGSEQIGYERGKRRRRAAQALGASADEHGAIEMAMVAGCVVPERLRRLDSQRCRRRRVVMIPLVVVQQHVRHGPAGLQQRGQKQDLRDPQLARQGGHRGVRIPTSRAPASPLPAHRRELELRCCRWALVDSKEGGLDFWGARGRHRAPLLSWRVPLTRARRTTRAPGTR